MDADSPDIHPIGWCDVTGHPLEVPYREYFVFVVAFQILSPNSYLNAVSSCHYKYLQAEYQIGELINHHSSSTESLLLSIKPQRACFIQMKSYSH